MPTQDIVLYGMPLGVLIMGIIAVARYMGMPTVWVPPLALGLGILGGEAAQAHALQIGATPDWIFGAISGISLGLLSSGIYGHAQVYVNAAIAKATGTTPTPVPLPVPDPPPPDPVVTP